MLPRHRPQVERAERLARRLRLRLRAHIRLLRVRQPLGNKYRADSGIGVPRSYYLRHETEQQEKKRRGERRKRRRREKKTEKERKEKAVK